MRYRNMTLCSVTGMWPCYALLGVRGMWPYYALLEECGLMLCYRKVALCSVKGIRPRNMLCHINKVMHYIREIELCQKVMIFCSVRGIRSYALCQRDTAVNIAIRKRSCTLSAGYGCLHCYREKVMHSVSGLRLSTLL